ncbi:hypothetical protein WT08_04130 [Burkholderia sp. MSMB1552]|nr:hypothetical protein WT08_04130 [Burkholderia sp. MSMB1552]KWZ51053.1 hypothetical protein WS92_27440 [Burkholderia sp. MSMB1588]
MPKKDHTMHDNTNHLHQQPSLAFVAASWAALLAIGLFNATLMHSEKGFYAMSFALALFGSVAVQKNTRDIEAAGRGRAETAIAADAAE